MKRWYLNTSDIFLTEAMYEFLNKSASSKLQTGRAQFYDATRSDMT